MKTILTIALAAACAAQPKFETASVKHVEECAFATNIDPAMVSLKGLPLKPVLQEAFKIKMDRITGPSWLDTDCFDIVAKIPEGATRDQVPAMLQALLADRFKLAAHIESHTTPGFALVVDKNGPKLKEDDPNINFMGNRPRGTIMIGNGGGRFKGVVTMPQLAHALSVEAHIPIEDLTGLKGTYNIDLTWAKNQVSVDDFAADPQPDLPTAVRETLGLRLDRRQATVETLVVDHIERVPTAN